MNDEDLKEETKPRGRLKRRSDFANFSSNKAMALRGLRKKKDLSMAQVAEAVGCSTALVSHLEQGRMDIPKKSVVFDKMLDHYTIEKDLRKWCPTPELKRHLLREFEVLKLSFVDFPYSYLSEAHFEAVLQLRDLSKNETQ